MHCNCGYAFHEAVKRSLKVGGDEEFKAYCVVPDKNFVPFVEAEIEAFKATPDTEEWVKAIAEAANLSGSLKECPQCGRLTLLGPGDSRRVFVEEQEGE